MDDVTKSLQTEASEWRKVFFISIAFYFLSNLFYLLFISGDVQDWNEPKTDGAIEDGSKKEKKPENNAAYYRRKSLGENIF